VTSFFYFICLYLSLFYFSLFLEHARGARRADPKGWWPYFFILLCLISYCIYFILVYFYNTYEVLVGLPQGVGGLAT
jgi:uncharacterized membrane protein